MKILQTKAIRIIFLLAFFIQNLYGQQQLGQGGTASFASPSMASMSLYTDNPVNLSGGVPEISFPIVDVPISDQNIKNSFRLNYNPAFVNTNVRNSASDVGAGWSLFGGSVIYKKVIDQLDERFDDNTSGSYKKNIFDDYYYYNLPGVSGKFQIKRDTLNNTFSLVNLTPNNVKFEYEEENNIATLKIRSFAVTNGKGYKFHFNDFDYETISDGGVTLGIGYKPAYFLSKITSPTGKILAMYTYEKKSKEAGFLNRLLYQYCKLKSIETDLGKVTFDYQYDESLANTPNDLYSLQKITLKNKADQEISSYSFNYIMSSRPSIVKQQKRLLASIQKNDKNGIKLEQTSFLYNQEFNFPPIPLGICDWGGSTPDSYYDNIEFTNVLKNVITPSGGVTQYEFAYNDFFFNHDQTYLDSILYGYLNSNVQYVVSQPKANFDTNLSSVYTFTISGDPTKKIGFNILFNNDGYHDPRDPRDPVLEDPLNPGHVIQPAFYTKYKIKNSMGEYLNKRSCTDGGEFWQNTYYGYPGTYTMEISGTGHGYGAYYVRETKFKPQPYKNIRKTPSISPRIKNIAYYKSMNDSQPARKINYNYDTEDGTGSSGYVFNSDSDGPDSAFESFVIYKNVKVSEDGNGYTRYSFITPNDYPKYQNGGEPLYPTYYYPYYNITKETLLSEKKVYNEQNQLLSSEKYNYELDDYSSDTYQFYIHGLYTSKPAYVKKVNTDIKNFTQNGDVMQVKREVAINKFNLSPGYTKETAAGGEVMEKQFIYAETLPEYTHIKNANMVSEPVQTIEKKNGRVISDIKVKFDNNKLQPTSLISTNPNDNSVKTSLRYDLYDIHDNLVQYTTVYDESPGRGFPSVIIWGYNGTMPIAKIDGASLAYLGNLADDIIAKSNIDVNQASEINLINALDIFRNNPALKDSQITTYTYDPLIGVTTLTPPNGMREIYKYDQKNKLQSVVNVNGNILKEFKYNIKQP